MRRTLSLGLVLASCASGLLALAACQGGGTPKPATPPPAEPKPEGPKPFYEGTPVMQARVNQEIAHFASDDLKERVDAAGQLAKMGDPAVSALIRALAEGPTARVRSMSAYTLGFLRDHRALDPLARALSDSDRDVRSEAATALARNGDDRGLATLIRSLEDTDPHVRAHAIAVLMETVGESLGFQPDDDPLDRQAAVARWKGWLDRRREQKG